MHNTNGTDSYVICTKLTYIKQLKCHDILLCAHITHVFTGIYKCDACKVADASQYSSQNCCPHLQLHSPTLKMKTEVSEDSGNHLPD
jgi:hypothetical protein